MYGKAGSLKKCKENLPESLLLLLKTILNILKITKNVWLLEAKRKDMHVSCMHQNIAELIPYNWTSETVFNNVKGDPSFVLCCYTI